MEFRFETRGDAKQSPFFLSDEEIDAGSTAYGWTIVILDEVYPEPEVEQEQIDQPSQALEWDGYCAVLARRFSKKNHPHLSYEDFFQEGRLKVCELLADNKYPLASALHGTNEAYPELSDNDEAQLTAEERQQYRALKDNVRFRSAIRRALLDYSSRNS